MSKKADQLIVSLAQQSYYEELLDIDVRIHLYKYNFLHAKHMSIDDNIALVGSSNMDIRSFALNAEISVIFYDQRVTAALIAQQELYFKSSEELTHTEWDKRGRLRRMFHSIARLLSPLL